MLAACAQTVTRRKSNRAMPSQAQHCLTTSQSHNWRPLSKSHTQSMAETSAAACGKLLLPLLHSVSLLPGNIAYPTISTESPAQHRNVSARLRENT